MTFTWSEVLSLCLWALAFGWWMRDWTKKPITLTFKPPHPGEQARITNETDEDGKPYTLVTWESPR